MSKHTPGPWHVGYRRVYAATDETIARRDGIDNPANARLIAAAPDLLAAAEGVATERTDTQFTVSREAIATLRAAIRKAKGGQ